MTQKPSTFLFSGGLDVASSPLVMSAGRVMSGMNYEVVAEGYRRSDGFERYDGRAAPSTAEFWSVPFRDGRSAPTLGTLLIGTTSGAQGTIIDVATSAGDWPMTNATGDIALANITGAFVDGEPLYSNGVLRAFCNGVADRNGAPDQASRLDRTAAAQDAMRALVGMVPGAGPVRGVSIYKGAVYAWRDNEAQTGAAMWKASSTGWQAVPFGSTMRFTIGLIEVIEGQTVVGATSGAQATAARVVRQDGDWGSTAAGYIVLAGLTGTFTAGEVLKVGTASVATVGAVAPITLPPGGRYQTVIHNFYGAANRLRLYGCNGVGNAFEFDGSVLAPIETGMGDADKPFLIFEVAEALGLVYPGGSVQVSPPGEPLIWDAVQGAFEFGFGSDVTNVVSSNDSAVALFGAGRIGILTGRDAATFQFSELTEEAGAQAWTAQRIGRTIYIDERGLRDLSATQAYGDFRAGSLLPELQPFFTARKKSGAKPVLSFVVKSKSQYRVLWDDGVGLSVYMGRKAPEPLLFSVKPVAFTCSCAGELADGEAILAGGIAGYLYRLDSGPSLDGVAVQGFVMTPFNHLGGVMMEKRLHKTTIEMDNPPDARVGITVMFDYGDDQQPMSGATEFYTRGNGGHDLLVSGGGGLWDTALWDEFFWSAPLKGKAEAYTEGQGVNMAVIVGCDSHAAEGSHTLQAYTLHWSPRKLRR